MWFSIFALTFRFAKVYINFDIDDIKRVNFDINARFSIHAA